MADALEVKPAFYVFCEFFAGFFPISKIREYDLHRHPAGFYHRLRRGHDPALYPAGYSQALPLPILPAISDIRDFWYAWQ